MLTMRQSPVPNPSGTKHEKSKRCSISTCVFSSRLRSRITCSMTKSTYSSVYCSISSLSQCETGRSLRSLSLRLSLCSQSAWAAVPSEAAEVSLSSNSSSNRADGLQCSHLCEDEAERTA